MKRHLFFFVGAVLLTAGCVTSPYFRPSEEFRSINAARYELVVQKNGGIDVLWPSGVPVIQNAFPMVWYDSEDAPEPLPVEGRMTIRQEVNDRLGQGQGMLLKKDECEWLINTYTTQPFITATVAYVNDGKEAVRIKALYPLAVGYRSEGAIVLGENAAASALLTDSGGGQNDFSRVQTTFDTATGQWLLAAYNPETNQSLVSGYITQKIARPELYITRDEEAEDMAFNTFTAACYFDPPIELQPGERLVSEQLYLGVAEQNALEGLGRFGNATALVNETRKRPFLPHGWNSFSSRYGREINEQVLLSELAAMAERLRPLGWSHLSVGEGWESLAGDWEPDAAKFPRGLKPITDAAHAQGMTAGVALRPYLVNRNSAVAQAHPEWVRPPAESQRARYGEHEAILDATNSEVLAHVEQICARAANDWGFDSLDSTLWTQDVMAAESFADKSLGRLAILDRAFQAVRNGFGARRFVMGGAPNRVAGRYCDGIASVAATAPAWSRDGDAVGFTEAAEAALRSFHYTPYYWSAAPGTCYFGHDATRGRWNAADAPALSVDQQQAWFTMAALCGGVVQFGDAPSDLTPQNLDILRRVLPVSDRAARPTDMFAPNPPQVWYTTIVGRGVLPCSVVAVMNYDMQAPLTVPVYLQGVGLDSQKVYAVYGFWEDRSYGLAQAKVDVTVPPGSLRLFTFRPHQRRPYFVALDHHFAMGANEILGDEWDSAARRLRGAFEAKAGTTYGLRLFVPEGYAPKDLAAAGEGLVYTMEGPLLRATITAKSDGALEWIAQF